MRTNIKYWINCIEGNNKKMQPQSKEEEAAYDIAEYYISQENKKIAA